MPDLPPLTIPAEALTKSAETVAGGRDYYADLTDEERAEEGLPPRETPAAETPKPVEKPAEPVGKPEPPATEPEPEPADLEDDDDIERLFEEIAGIREDIAASLGKPEPAATTKNEDPLLKAALEHEDEVIRGLAERLQKAESRLEAREKEAEQQRVSRFESEVATEKAALKRDYLIDGKPITDAQLEQIEDFAEKNPAAGGTLSIEKLARVVFDSVTKRGRSPSAPSPGDPKPNGVGQPVATIVDGGSSGGSSPEPWKPRPNETIESAVKEAGRILFPGIKR